MIANEQQQVRQTVATSRSWPCQRLGDDDQLYRLQGMLPHYPALRAGNYLRDSLWLRAPVCVRTRTGKAAWQNPALLEPGLDCRTPAAALSRLAIIRNGLCLKSSQFR